jgi:hypothetical protein
MDDQTPAMDGIIVAGPGFDRDERGRFLRGCKPGPGAPRLASAQNRFRRALLDAITAEDVQGIAATLVGMAKAGDTAAAKLVLAYALGSPEEITTAAQREEAEDALREALEPPQNRTG